MNKIRHLFNNEALAIAVVFIAALTIRLYFVFADVSPLENDEKTYDKIAMSILNRHEFAIEQGQPTAYITPLYPVFLSLVYRVSGHSYLSVKVFQALLGALLCLIVYRIAKETFGQRVALLASALTAMHYYFIRYGLSIFSENLFIIFVGLSLMYLVRFLKAPNYTKACLFGLFSSLATLTRSAFFLFPFFVIAVICLMRGYMAINYQRVMKFSIAMLFCFLLPISMWTARNYFVFKKIIPLGTETGVVLYAAYNPPEGKILDKAVHDDKTWQASQLPEYEYGQFLIRETIASIKNDPSKLYRYIPLKLMYFFSVFDWAAFKTAGAYNFSTAFILPLAFLGVFLALKKRTPWVGLTVLLPLVYFLFITMAIMGVPRTRLPVEPCMIIFAAFFIYNIYTRSNHKIIVAAAITGWYFINYLMYLNSAQVKIAARGIFQGMGLW